jgi:hypothetical protein
LNRWGDCGSPAIHLGLRVRSHSSGSWLSINLFLPLVEANLLPLLPTPVVPSLASSRTKVLRGHTPLAIDDSLAEFAPPLIRQSERIPNGGVALQKYLPSGFEGNVSSMVRSSIICSATRATSSSTSRLPALRCWLGRIGYTCIMTPHHHPAELGICHKGISPFQD